MSGNSWHVYCPCSLCSAKTSHHSDDDHEVASAAAEVEARALGWVQLPDVRGDRVRFAGWVCKPCAMDVAGAHLMAGRATQAPARATS